MSQGNISSKGAYRNTTHSSKNDPFYQLDRFNAIEQLFKYTYTKRDIELRHRSNRNTKRKTNQNKVVNQVTIIELMREFVLKKDLSEAYNVPQDLKFFRKFYKSYTGSITFSTLYTSFRDMKLKEFMKKFPNITFNNLSLSLSKQLGTDITEQMLNDDYETIKDFLSTF